MYVAAAAHGSAGQDEGPSVPLPRETEVFQRGGHGDRLLLETREADPARCEHRFSLSTVVHGSGKACLLPSSVDPTVSIDSMVARRN